MAKMTKVIASVCVVGLVLLVLWRLAEGYRTGWSTTPNQFLFKVAFSPRSPDEMRDWVAALAIRKGYRRVDTGVVSEFQAVRGNGGITWRYPLPNSESSDLYGGIEVWSSDDIRVLSELIVFVDAQIPSVARVVRGTLTIDPQTYKCEESCRVDFPHPVDAMKLTQTLSEGRRAP